MHLQHLAALGPLLYSFGVTGAADEHFDVLNFVDPLIGTTDGGHVFPGASMPYGMAKPVADVVDERQGGFSTNDSPITGFSHMHDSGTGGGASLGNFPLFPQTGCPGDDLYRCNWNKHDRATKRINGTAEARPGYFAVTLNTSIHAEMTATNHTALYRFTFPKGLKSREAKAAADGSSYKPVILSDLTDLADSRGAGNMTVDPKTGRLTGSGVFRPSFGIGTYRLHFCADFKGAKVIDTGVWMNNRPGSDPKTVNVPNDQSSPPLPAGAWVQFEAPGTNQILARVGMSYKSVEQACRSAEKEIPNFDFRATRYQAEDAWREKLNVVKVNNKGISSDLQKTFWSGIYRSLISPQDYTGENYLWDSDEPYFDSYYCIWDSARTTHPLITLVDPHAQALMVRSLIDIYRHEGHLPDCRMSLCKGYTQGGSNADNVLADSYLKGITDGINWEDGYKAVVADAEIQPENWGVAGRGGLHSWKKLGYIPTDDYDPYSAGLFTRSISRTVEYAYNDFCIAEMAREMGKHADAEKYLKSSGNWKNMFDPESRSGINTTGSPNIADFKDSGFKGFLQPRYLNGTFGFQEPALCSPGYNFTSCYLNPDGHETYEGGSWLYTFAIPHDQATLIPTLGGPEEFERRLRYFHDTPGLFYIGDEPSYVHLFLFHYIGRPGISSEYAHKYIPSSFNSTVGGLPGNDDSGAMGSFVVLVMMGLFPMSGQDVYLIVPPFFESVSIKNPVTGKTATIKSKNFDTGYTNKYIQSATLNGKPYTKSWINHDIFREGGTLELTLGPKESTKWGTGKDDIPPSASTHFWKD